MTFISSTVPNLVNGISQQPPAYRLETQAEKQVNGISSIVYGLQKRPGTVNANKLSALTSTISTGTFIKTLNYGEEEFYSLVITPTGLNVFDKDGILKQVTATNNSSGAAPTLYLSGMTTPASELTAVTIGDHTYISNTTKTVAEDSTLTATRPHEGLIYVKQGDYSTEYQCSVTVGSTVYSASYTTRDSSNTVHEPDVQTTNIATSLAGALNLPSSISKSVDGNIIHLSSSSTPFEISSTDDQGDQHIHAFKGQTVDFKKLPPKGPVGFKLKIIGDNEKSQDDYYVELADPDGTGQLVWKETTADNIKYKLDASTMPHVLIKQPNGVFEFKEGSWDERLVGDDETNPFPSFVGDKVRDLFFYRNRLGILSKENVVLSEVGDFFNFFHDTTLVLVDSTPIDVSISTGLSTPLKYVIPFSDSLMLFAEEAQFTLSSGTVLAHDTINIDVSTKFEADLRSRPAASSTFVFFPTLQGNWGGLREYYVATDTEARNAENITSHIPKYIEGPIRKITSSATVDMLCVTATDKPSELYVHNFFWANQEKKQSAWHKWDMGGTIYNVDFINSKLVFIIDRDGEPFMEILDLAEDSADLVMDYGVGLLLDRRFKLSAAASTIPYTASNILFYNQYGSELGTLTAAQVATHFTTYPNDTLYGGFNYNFEYELSEIIMRSDGAPVYPSTLKLKDITIQYSKTATFNVVVSPNLANGSFNRPTMTRTYSGVLGNQNLQIARVLIDTGRYRVGVWGDAENVKISLTNDTPFPSNFQTAEWRATYHKLAKVG